MRKRYSNAAGAASVVAATPLDVAGAPNPSRPGARFWWTHAWLPLGGFLVVFTLLELGGADRRVAQALFHAHGQWLGTGAGDWWAHRLLHDGGRWVVRGVAATAAAAWGMSFLLRGTRRWRHAAGFVFTAIVASVAVVGGLKSLTNVDCPRDLAGFGGARPYVALFADRADYLPRGRCFPGAHSSSGFALVCFYFLWRGRRPRAARAGLVAACLMGVAFSVGQQARGAHFLTHDLASAGLVWFVQLALQAWRNSPALQQYAGERVADHARGEATEDVPRPAQPQPGRDATDQARIQRREIDGALPVQQHVRHDDGHERADRCVPQRSLDAMVEPEA
jgi:membrane-associated PAP2 superfamily phosphatase